MTMRITRWLPAVVAAVTLPGGWEALAQRRAAVVDQENLAKRVASVSQELATIIRSPDTRIEQLSTPFFANASIYRVTHLAPTHPIVYTVGCAGSEYTVLLALNPDGFFELSSRAGFNLRSDEERVGYVITFLESTRNFG